MTDIKVALREYLEASQPVSLEETIEGATTQPKRLVAQRPRPMLVAAAAAVVVLLVVGSAWLLSAGDTSPVVTQPIQPSSTIPQATTIPAPVTTLPQTTTPTPATTVPPTAEPQPVVSDQWTVYSSEQGLPGAMAGVAIGADGTVWAASGDAVGILSRLEGEQWTEVGYELDDATHMAWMVAHPDGGVMMAVSSTERGPWRIVRFDGDSWHETIDSIPHVSAVVMDQGRPRILGYGGPGLALVDVRYADGAYSVNSAGRGDLGRSSPSLFTVWDSVDVSSDGTAWYGTAEGPWRFDGDSLELIPVGAGLSDTANGCCAPLAVDAHDNVWIHMGFQGTVFRISPDGQQTKYTSGDVLVAGINAPSPIVPTSDGEVWILGHQAGVGHFDGDTWTNYTASEAQESGIPTRRSFSGSGVVDGSDGSTWTLQAVGDQPTLHRYFDGQWTPVPTAGISWGSWTYDGTHGMAVAPDGSLWIPTSTGVARFQPTGN